MFARGLWIVALTLWAFLVIVAPSVRPLVFHAIVFGASFLCALALLVVLHELGHAIAAVLVRQRVYVVRVGTGRVLWRVRLFGAPRGMAAHTARGERHRHRGEPPAGRLRRAIFIAAGPLVTIATFAFIASHAHWTWRTFSGMDVVWTAALWANAVLLACCLLPFDSPARSHCSTSLRTP
jgi:hypothetical protein